MNIVNTAKNIRALTAYNRAFSQKKQHEIY